MGQSADTPALLLNYSLTLVEVQNKEERQIPAPLLNTSTLSLSYEPLNQREGLKLHLVDAFSNGARPLLFIRGSHRLARRGAAVMPLGTDIRSQ